MIPRLIENLQVGTVYKVQGFAPIHWLELERELKAIRPGSFRRMLKRLSPLSVIRDGEKFMPIQVMLDHTRFLPQTFVDYLYSKPMWEVGFHNVVVTTGLTDIIDKYFKGSSYTAAHYVLLLSSSPTVAAGDTMASHSGWTEVTTYSQANRVTPTWGTVSSGSVDNSASKAVFSITGTVTVGGAGLTTNNTKGGSTGTFYGGGAFAEGNRSLINGDTLNVQVTATATAS